MVDDLCKALLVDKVTCCMSVINEVYCVDCRECDFEDVEQLLY